VSEESNVEELEATIRALRRENERLKDELTRLRRERDERPPHYL
jgi:predicted RNase H-like nuclease (RuvC/YqgF family)